MNCHSLTLSTGVQNCAVTLKHSLKVCYSVQLVQSLSHVQLFVTQWIAARQASPSITNSRSLPKLKSTESAMPSNHLILCHPLLLPSIFLIQLNKNPSYDLTISLLGVYL